MSDTRTPIVILMADDDKDDQLLAKEALEESRVANEFIVVNDGVELMEYLRKEGQYAEGNHPWPSLILLDLNMPRKDGREALAEIKLDPKLRRLPVVILTTSKTEEDMLKGYDLGAASYLTKPVTFEGLVDLMRALGQYWVEFVELPGQSTSNTPHS
ncbi:MAG: response regulator [Pseudomonadales bacterium]|nr:response regulator [Pseudomonadales bacterium]